MKQIVGNERERERERGVDRAPTTPHLGKKKEAKQEMEGARDMRVRWRSRVKERKKHSERGWSQGRRLATPQGERETVVVGVRVSGVAGRANGG